MSIFIEHEDKAVGYIDACKLRLVLPQGTVEGPSGYVIVLTNGEQYQVATDVGAALLDSMKADIDQAKAQMKADQDEKTAELRQLRAVMERLATAVEQGGAKAGAALMTMIREEANKIVEKKNEQPAGAVAGA